MSGADATTLYDRELYIRHYERHNADVRDYFAQRPDDFIEIDLAATGAYPRFCRFLGKPAIGESFPWENASTARS
jgi:hypothetical protein